MYLRDSFPKSLAPRVLLTLLLWGNHQRDGSPAWHFNKIWTICIFFKRLFFNFTLSKGFSYSPFLLSCLGEHWPRRLMIKWPQSQTREPPSSRLSCVWVITELIFSINWVDKCNCGQCEAWIRTLYSNSEHLYITGQIRHKNNWSSNYSWIRLLFRGLQWVILGHGVRGKIPGCKCYLKGTP